MKRVLKWVGIVLALLVLVLGAVGYSIFGTTSPIVDQGELAPGVVTVKDGIVSVVVLDAGHERVALIDAGNDGSGKAILATLGRRGLAPSSVAAIFLTHGHGDHIAACHLFPDAAIYAMEADVALASDKAKVTHPLKDGEVVDVGDLRVEAFAVPGHTPGSAVYLARGVLFFGDSAGASKKGELTQAVRLFSKDPAENVASLKALAARLEPRRGEIKKLALAHTGPLDGFEPLEAFAKGH